jgi:hypothetical protein
VQARDGALSTGLRRPLRAQQRWRHALLLIVSALILPMCSSAAPGSPSSGSITIGSTSSPSSSPLASVLGSETTTPSPAWTVAQATTLGAHLPTGLGREVAIVVGTQVIVYGGFASTGSTTNAILAFDPGAGTITRIGALAVSVHDAAGVALGGVTWIFGGGNSAVVSAVQRIDSNAVGSVVGHLPAARADLSAVSIGPSAFVIAGGASGVMDRSVLATEDGTRFRVVATLLYGVRYAAVAEAGGLIYVIGGVGAGGDRTDMQRVDPATGKVDLIGQMPEPISHAWAIVRDGRLLVIGGRSAGQPQDAIWEVAVGSGSTRLVGRLPQPLSDFAIADVAGTIYVIGGETSTQVASIVALVLQ